MSWTFKLLSLINLKTSYRFSLGSREHLHVSVLCCFIFGQHSNLLGPYAHTPDWSKYILRSFLRGFHHLSHPRPFLYLFPIVQCAHQLFTIFVSHSSMCTLVVHEFFKLPQLHHWFYAKTLTLFLFSCFSFLPALVVFQFHIQYLKETLMSVSLPHTYNTGFYSYFLPPASRWFTFKPLCSSCKC